MVNDTTITALDAAIARAEQAEARLTAALARAEAAEAAHRAEQRLTASSWRAAQAYVQRIGELEADRDAALARAAAAEARVAELVDDVRRYSSAGAELAARAIAAEARALDLERRLAAALERGAPPSHTAPVDDAADAACRACEVWRRSK